MNVAMTQASFSRWNQNQLLKLTQRKLAPPASVSFVAINNYESPFHLPIRPSRFPPEHSFQALMTRRSWE
jgi:hypothetical protein